MSAGANIALKRERRWTFPGEEFLIGRGRNLSEERNHLTLVVKTGEPQRLDSFLVSNLAWKSRSRLQGLIKDGRVTVNGEKTKASRRVHFDDVVEIRLSSGLGLPDDYSERKLDIIYEDEWLVVVNKPPGMLVHPVGRHVYDTLINYLHHRYHSIDAGQEEVIPKLCHRLDRDTTGVVVVGKKNYVHRDVQQQFEKRTVSKSYLALANGLFPPDRNEIDIPIGEGRCLKSALEQEPLKDSRTLVTVLDSYGDHTLLRCVPCTGRQNQIRIHLAAVGHPIAGDERYGGDSPGERQERRDWPLRYLLHSESIRFWHPRLKQDIELAAPLPPDFQALL
ncbi:MAG: RluA family pseudouridine synthase [Planctomycetota bacterium]|nr:RluA family pseudouridine synthase [Planctomycetota bacterium]